MIPLHKSHVSCNFDRSHDSSSSSANTFSFWRFLIPIRGTQSCAQTTENQPSRCVSREIRVQSKPPGGSKPTKRTELASLRFCFRMSANRQATPAPREWPMHTTPYPWHLLARRSSKMRLWRRRWCASSAQRRMTPCTKRSCSLSKGGTVRWPSLAQLKGSKKRGLAPASAMQSLMSAVPRTTTMISWRWWSTKTPMGGAVVGPMFFQEAQINSGGAVMERFAPLVTERIKASSLRAEEKSSSVVVESAKHQ
mmetsp:Transcript_40228/g.108685  ORF Transcript_40228/g.108685 Transcript_40228/m.108685 type:complete len:252 (-) Transcript_40228:60-815(-)